MWPGQAPSASRPSAPALLTSVASLWRATDDSGSALASAPGDPHLESLVPAG
jgi:hypothetical protein